MLRNDEDAQAKSPPELARLVAAALTPDIAAVAAPWARRAARLADGSGRYRVRVDATARRFHEGEPGLERIAAALRRLPPVNLLWSYTAGAGACATFVPPPPAAAATERVPWWVREGARPAAWAAALGRFLTHDHDPVTADQAAAFEALVGPLSAAAGAADLNALALEVEVEAEAEATAEAWSMEGIMSPEAAAGAVERLQARRPGAACTFVIGHCFRSVALQRGGPAGGRRNPDAAAAAGNACFALGSGTRTVLYTSFI